MSPFDGLMNHVAELSRSEFCFTRNISTRAATILGGIPLEIAAMAQNVILLPFQPIGVTSRVVVKVFNFCINSQVLKDIENFLPGFSQIVITAYKIVAYAIGTIFTCFLGFLSPMSNFRLHCTLGLIHDERAEAERMQFEEEEAKQRELQEAMIQAKIQAKLFSIRQKAVEQERLRAEEAQKEKETQAAISKLAKAEEGKKQASLSIRFNAENLNQGWHALSAKQEETMTTPQIQEQINKKMFDEIRPLPIDLALSQFAPQNNNALLKRIAILFKPNLG